MTVPFQNAKLHLGQADPGTVAALLSAAADLTLIVDRTDIIEDISHNFDQPFAPGLAAWRGLPLGDVIRTASRTHVQKALRLSRKGKPTGRFDVSHPIEGFDDLALQYSAFAIGGDGGVALVGRNLQPALDLQAMLSANRSAQTRNVSVQKQAEAHYRLLFETASDAIVMIDPQTGKVREINPRAAALLGIGYAAAAGRKFSSLFSKADAADIKAMLAGLLATGAAKSRVHNAAGEPIALSAQLFRAGDLKLAIVRLASTDDAEASTAGAEIETLVRDAAEAIVLTDDQGKVLWTNESFLVLAAIPLAAHALRKPFADYFQVGGADRVSLYDTIRRHGRIASIAGTILGANGQTTEVELSAVATGDGPSSGFGFVMRAQDADGGDRARGNSDLTRTAERLVEMVGRVPMKDLVRDTTDVIERMCIEAALKLTGNNRASTARVLGLSRQALYLKMNRFGITDGA